MGNKKFDDKQLYPLLYQNDFEKIKDFLSKYGLDSVDRDGRTFLITCIFEKKNEFAKQLIELGANINHQDESGVTSLMAAITAKNSEMMDYLLSQHKLQVNVQNSFGKNALAIALQNSPRDKELMIKLIKKGADPFLKLNNGQSTYYSLIQEFQSGKRTIGGEKLDFQSIIQLIEAMQ